MKGVNNIMARDDNTPLTFQLPDGDNVALITWGYVVSKLEEVLTPTLDSIEIINISLEKIDNKLSQWVDEN
jgi:hypothetical protein